jgi:hypothetical protein
VYLHPEDVFDTTATIEQQTQWENLTGFLARLTGLSDIENGGDSLNFSNFALWAMRDAFEEEHSEGENVLPSLKLANLWITHSGEKLWKLAAKDHKFSERLGIAGAKFSESGWKGFNTDRWAAWRKGFEAMRDSVPAAEQKKLVDTPVKIMTDV